MTRYALEAIAANPFRNIDRYPIDRTKVDKLKESIGRTAFWDNLVARRGAGPGEAQVAYGHHRLVALRELYPPEHEVELIIRELDDATMLRIMADENMQEWSSSAGVTVETVRAVRDFLARARLARASRPGQPVTAIADFLGWPHQRVHDALTVIAGEEAGELEPADTAGLPLRTAATMRSQIAPIRDPELRRRAIATVRDDVAEGRIGHRGVGDTVARVRAEAAPAHRPPIVPQHVARGLFDEADRFFRVAVPTINGSISRGELADLIADNRGAVELQGIAAPWADQIAEAFDRLAEDATRYAARLRAGSSSAHLALAAGSDR